MSHTGQDTACVVWGKKFACSLDGHHGDGRVTVCARMPRGENARTVAAEPALRHTGIHHVEEVRRASWVVSLG
jgi:hypothetical protein